MPARKATGSGKTKKKPVKTTRKLPTVKPQPPTVDGAKLMPSEKNAYQKSVKKTVKANRSRRRGSKPKPSYM